jgi:hypothetical protein
LIPDFPPPFARLQEIYRAFEPTYEYRRESFAEWWAHYLGQVDLKTLQAEINSGSPIGQEIGSQLKQRHFYRSATSFYRSFDLLLSYLCLQRSKFGTWAQVTGYYCRFYFIQAFLNLLQSSWFGSEDSIPPAGLISSQDKRFFAYSTGTSVALLREKELGAAGVSNTGTHGIWWSLYGCLGNLSDFPQIETLEFVLSDGYFNPRTRNVVNYSHEYIEGFPELEWFDSSTESMMSQFACQMHRPDRDITDIDRFFEGGDPENIDTGDFYGDDAQMLWCSIDCYLRILLALGVNQNFITVDKLEALTRAHIGDDFPRLTEGIAMALRESLS